MEGELEACKERERLADERVQAAEADAEAMRVDLHEAQGELSMARMKVR